MLGKFLECSLWRRRIPDYLIDRYQPSASDHGHQQVLLSAHFQQRQIVQYESCRYSLGRTSWKPSWVNEDSKVYFEHRESRFQSRCEIEVPLIRLLGSSAKQFNIGYSMTCSPTHSSLITGVARRMLQSIGGNVAVPDRVSA